MLLAKKLISALFFPTTIVFGLLVVGLALLWLTKRQRAGKIAVTASAVVFALFGYRCSSDRMLAHLEQQHLPVLAPSADDDSGPDPIKWVLVLGAGHAFDPRMPPTNNLSPTALARLTEGMRLHRLLPKTKLLLSGGPGFGSVPHAVVLRDAALSLGVPGDDIVIEPRPQDTEQEAQLDGAIVGHDRFYLVTSAQHMPRALALFQRVGARAVPSPADYVVHGVGGTDPDGVYPNGRNFVNASNALHEYLGMVWSKLRGTM